MASKLSATDRKQLCKITEGRFEMLNQELSARKNDISEMIKKHVIDSHKGNIKKIEDRLSKVKEERKLTDLEYQNKLDEVDKKRKIIIKEAKEMGLTVSKPSYGQDIEEISPTDLNSAVREKANQIYKEYNAAKINLRTLELETLEKISVAGLETDDARDFMTEIPDIDKLLPAPAQVKALIEG